MEIKLLKTEIQGVKLFENGLVELDLITTKKVKPEEVEEHIVEHLFSNVYKHNLLAFAGINASGKTTTLKLLSMVLELFIQNKSLETLSNPEVLEHLENKCRLTNTFYFDKRIYMLASSIERGKNGKFEFIEESLKVKTARSNLSKEKLFDFREVVPERTRQEVEKLAMGYLRSDTSIFMQVLKEAGVLDGRRYVYDMTQFTNINIFGTLNTIPAGYIQYLDPDIESIEFINRDNSQNYSDLLVKVKFYEQQMKEITAMDLWKYLSSGTIKGLNLLLAMQQVLKIGGYMVIDELENHLNKTVAITLINLFKSEVNTQNATLIFSTHYSEILDDIERSDSIYFSTKNKGQITLSNLSTHSNRVDKKKSNLYLSGLLGTAPKYSGYRALKKSLKDEIKMSATSINEEA